VRSIVVEEAPFQGLLTVIGIVRPAETVPLVVVHGGRLRYAGRHAAGLRTGVQVSTGEVLAVIENESLQHGLVEARLEAESAAAELERVRKGYEAGIVPEADFASQTARMRMAQQRLESAARQADRLTLSAPRNGRLVVTAAVPPGSEVAAGSVVGEIAGEGRPLVEGWAAAADRERLRPGQSVRCVARAETAASCRGRIREVAPVVDSAGTLRIVAEVDDATGLPAPGEGVAIEVELERHDGALCVPQEALVVVSGGHSVFVLSPRGESYSARRVNVETGDRAGGRVEILRGLNHGDRVAVAGVSMLTDGATAVESPQDEAAGDEGEES
jgi:cobalt-zinc-cadmium efflux system membrane fusion protein